MTRAGRKESPTFEQRHSEGFSRALFSVESCHDCNAPAKQRKHPPVEQGAQHKPPPKALAPASLRGYSRAGAADLPPCTPPPRLYFRQMGIERSSRGRV